MEGQFYLGFTHRFHEFRNATVYFAFCFPWSYTESQDRLTHYDKEFGDCQMLTAKRLAKQEVPVVVVASHI